MLRVETVEQPGSARGLRRKRLAVAISLLLLTLAGSNVQGAVFHTNATFKVTFSLPGVEQAVNVVGPPPTTFYTAIPGKIANQQILQALTPFVPNANLSGATLMLRTFDIGTPDVRSSFILRKGTNDFDLSSYMSFSLPSAHPTITAQTTASGGATNQTDYTIMQFSFQTPQLNFDVQGFTTFKMSSIVDRGTVVQSQPFPTTISASVDGAGNVDGHSFIYHGTVSLTAPKVDIVQDPSP